MNNDFDEIPSPERVKAINNDKLLYIRVEFNAEAILLMFITTFVSLIVVLFLIKKEEDLWVIYAFSSILAISFYLTMVLHLNKIHIHVTDNHILVRHRPLPFLMRKKVLVKDINSLFVKEKVTSYTKGTVKAVSRSYELRVNLKKRGDKLLYFDNDNDKIANFLKKIITQWLGL